MIGIPLFVLVFHSLNVPQKEEVTLTVFIVGSGRVRGKYPDCTGVCVQTSKRKISNVKIRACERMEF